MNFELGILNSKFLIPNCLCIALAATACGRKGPPLPPIVRMPAAPAEFRAERRGNTVELAFIAPATNTDKTRPADIERVDVYGYTGPASITEAELLKQSERIGSVVVRQPRDPDRTIDPDEPASDLEPLEAEGIDQGAATQLLEELTPEMLAPSVAAAGSEPAADGRPLPAFPCTVPTRTYLSVGVSTSGRRGPASPPARVPLVPAPPPPSQPAIEYDEAAVVVTWTTAPADAGAAPKSEAILPSRPLACGAPGASYHVYEVTAGPTETRVTAQPVDQSPFVDKRVEWGVERCYTVRTVHTIDELSVESEPAPPACVTLTDTFAPAPPRGLVAVASEGAISLIWDANGENDLAGYIVLRAPADTRQFAPIVAAPVQDTTLVDKVEAGVPYIYTVVAVDTAGNRSAPSAEAGDTAR
jgi:hypothetical protein